VNQFDPTRPGQLDARSLALSPLPRRIAVVEGGQHTVYVDGDRLDDAPPVDLLLCRDQPADDTASTPRNVPPASVQVPVLSVDAAFTLFMPEHMPPASATPDQVALAWFHGCQDTAPGATSLQMAADVLPVGARQERRVLRAAVERARTVQESAAATVDPTGSLTGPLHQAGWRHADPHTLLDACFSFLRQVTGRGFEERSGQTQMAHEVLDALLDQTSLVVEAGTGTGKTLAYALPAVLVSALRDMRIVLSTHTRNLQQQLITHDLPWLWQHLGLAMVERAGDRTGLAFAKLLGRTNYVCRHALQSWIEQERRRGGSVRAAQVLLALLRSPDGTLEDVLPDLPPSIWSQIHSRRGSCVGRRCRGETPCPVYRVREAARPADLLVVNHALLMADARGGRGILGEWHALVVDEAHHVPRVATEALGHRLGSAPIEALGRPLGQLEHEARRIQPLPQGERCGTRALEWCGEQRQLQHRLMRWWGALDAALPRQPRVPVRQRYLDGAEVFGCIAEETDTLRDDLQVSLRQGLQTVTSLQDVLVEWPQGGELLELLEISVGLLQEVVVAFAFVVRGDDDEWTFFLDFSGDASALREIVALPLDVATELPQLLQIDEIGVVFTSATLCVDDDTAWFRRQIGAADSLRTLHVESPFDHERQCLLAQTANLGDWRDADFVPQVADLVAALQASTGRRTMVLLTSRRILSQLQDELRARISPAVVLLSQSDPESRSLLARRFTATPGAILLGLASFWEGVDFPGQALELLVIPKLPFLVPTDPLVEARCQRLRARGEDPFAEYLLPEAILRLRQGFGRLLRSPRDRGAVVLLDARLETRPYGGEFLRPLPLPSQVFEDSDSLVRTVAAWCERSEPLEAMGSVPVVDFLPEDA
jgi:Rad3-related DNA helicase